MACNLTWLVALPFWSRKMPLNTWLLERVFEAMNATYAFRPVQHYGMILQNGTIPYKNSTVFSIIYEGAHVSSIDFEMTNERLKRMSFASIPVSFGSMEFVFNRKAIRSHVVLQIAHLTQSMLLLLTMLGFFGSVAIRGQRMGHRHRKGILMLLSWFLLFERIYFRINLVNQHVVTEEPPIKRFSDVPKLIRSKQYSLINAGAGSSYTDVTQSNYSTFVALREALQENPLVVQNDYYQILADIASDSKLFTFMETFYSLMIGDLEIYDDIRIIRGREFSYNHFMAVSKSVNRVCKAELNRAQLSVHLSGFVEYRQRIIQKALRFPGSLTTACGFTMSDTIQFLPILMPFLFGALLMFAIEQCRIEFRSID